MAAIETVGLRRSFPQGLALDNLTIEAHEGEVLALLGPNGAGKTTTVRLLNGVLRPDAGRASVLGFDPAVQGEDVRRNTGVLTEAAGMDDRLTASENLEFVARIRGFGRRDSAKRIGKLLERFGMAEYADRQVQGFSTGQRKRLALARALLHDPQVLFLDEPTSGLDPSATRDVVELIASLATEHGRTVLLCTHFLGEAGRLADRMAVLHRGRLQVFGRPADIAAELWPGLDADVDLGATADSATAASVAVLRGVVAAEPSAAGLRLRVEDREVLPRIVAHLVDRGLPVYACEPRPPTLEDVYFAVEARMAANEPAPAVPVAAPPGWER
jgi:ABC-2 type transport system ATP-binding protein